MANMSPDTIRSVLRDIPNDILMAELDRRKGVEVPVKFTPIDGGRTVSFRREDCNHISMCAEAHNTGGRVQVRLNRVDVVHMLYSLMIHAYVNGMPLMVALDNVTNALGIETTHQPGRRDNVVDLLHCAIGHTLRDMLSMTPSVLDDEFEKSSFGTTISKLYDQIVDKSGHDFTYARFDKKTD